MHDFVCVTDGWICNPLVLELDRVRQSLAPGGFDVACMGAVMFW